MIKRVNIAQDLSRRHLGSVGFSSIILLSALSILSPATSSFASGVAIDPCAGLYARASFEIDNLIKKVALRRYKVNRAIIENEETEYDEITEKMLRELWTTYQDSPYDREALRDGLNHLASETNPGDRFIQSFFLISRKEPLNPLRAPFGVFRTFFEITKKTDLSYGPFKIDFPNFEASAQPTVPRYLISNEAQYHLFKKALKNRQGGIYIGVGGSQNYTIAGYQKADKLVFFVDNDPWIPSLHKLNSVFFKFSKKDPDAFLGFWSELNQEKVSQWLRKNGYPDLANIYLKMRPAVFSEYSRLRYQHPARVHLYRHHIGQKEFLGPSFLNDLEMFDYISSTFIENKVRIIQADYSRTDILKRIYEESKPLKPNAVTFYSSNSLIDEYVDLQNREFHEGLGLLSKLVDPNNSTILATVGDPHLSLYGNNAKQFDSRTIFLNHASQDSYLWEYVAEPIENTIGRIKHYNGWFQTLQRVLNIRSTPNRTSPPDIKPEP